MSAPLLVYRSSWVENLDRRRHLHEERGTMTICEDDGTVCRRVLMRSLCRHTQGWEWCDTSTLDSVFPPCGDPADGVWCADCRRTLQPDDDTDAVGTGSLLDLLQEVGS